MKRRVVVGLVGTQLDMPGGRRRKAKWRPTVSIAQQAGFFIDRMELLVDEDFVGLGKKVAGSIERHSPGTEVVLNQVNFNDPWDFAEVYGTLLDFAEGYNWDPEHEDYLVHITTGTHVAQICWFLLTEARFVPGRLLQSSPPSTGIYRDLKETSDQPDIPGKIGIVDLDLSRYDSIAQRFAERQQEATSFLKSGIETQNALFNAMIDQIERVALRSAEPMLLTGPTGAGKSLLASRIFSLKKTRDLVAGEFVEVNCATLRGDQAMSALFGHVRGAFTGANQARTGLMRQADKGVLFLDEIGELGLDEQAMLLRAIEEKRFFPFGGDKTVSSDFQLIAGTNRNLRQRVAEGRFREDLLARLDLWTYELPALRDRPEDIEPNLDFEIQKFSKKLGVKLTMNREARNRFMRFATGPMAMWSGNFRDLSACVIRMGTLCENARINQDVVEAECQRLARGWGGNGNSMQLADARVLERYLDAHAISQLDRFDRPQLSEVIRVCEKSANMSEAGRILFAVSRTKKQSSNDGDRLKKYLARFDLAFSDLRE